MSLHTLFDKYSDHMLVKFEQIRMVRTIQNFELFDKNGYSGIFYSCQFIKSFRPFHSFWEEEDLSGRSIQVFQNDTIIISWLFSFRVIQATVQWHTFKTVMFVFINSSSSQKLFCQVPNQYRSLMTFRNKIQAKTFTWPDMSFYAR